MELGGEDACTGSGTKNTQVEYEQQLIDDGHAAHGVLPNLANHDIIQQGNKVGNAVLYDNGKRNSDYMSIKRSVSYIFLY